MLQGMKKNLTLLSEIRNNIKKKQPHNQMRLFLNPLVRYEILLSSATTVTVSTTAAITVTVTVRTVNNIIEQISANIFR